VLADQHAFIDRARAAKNPVVLIDAPLLLEAGFDRFCHHIIFVEASESTRLGRAMSRTGWSEADFRTREASQMPIEAKKARSGFVLHNNPSDQSIEQQIRPILDTIGEEGSPRPNA